MVHVQQVPFHVLQCLSLKKAARTRTQSVHLHALFVFAHINLKHLEHQTNDIETPNYEYSEVGCSGSLDSSAKHRESIQSVTNITTCQRFRQKSTPHIATFHLYTCPVKTPTDKPLQLLRVNTGRS